VVGRLGPLGQHVGEEWPTRVTLQGAWQTAIRLSGRASGRAPIRSPSSMDAFVSDSTRRRRCVNLWIER